MKDRPRVIAAARPRAGAAIVTAPFARGELFLEGGKRTLRLTWEAGDGDRRRYVPAGRYRLIAYRIFEGDWTLASSGVTRVLELEPERKSTIPIDAATELRLSAIEEGGELLIQWMARAEAGEGRSFYRGSKRIPARYRVEDARGRLLVEGRLAYG